MVFALKCGVVLALVHSKNTELSENQNLTEYDEIIHECEQQIFH